MLKFKDLFDASAAGAIDRPGGGFALSYLKEKKCLTPGAKMVAKDSRTGAEFTKDICKEMGAIYSAIFPKNGKTLKQKQNKAASQSQTSPKVITRRRFHSSQCSY